MRIRLTVIIGCAALTLAAGACADLVPGDVTEIARPALNVTGVGTIEVAPDTLRVTASVITEGDTVAVARERNAQIGQRALAAVKALDLPNVATKTVNYSMERVTRDGRTSIRMTPGQFDIPWRLGETEDLSLSISYPVVLGYQASNELTVRVKGDDVDELSQAARKIIDALMAAGTNKIASVAYSLEGGHSEAQRQALVKAVKDAQLTADAVAEAAGRKIVGIRHISPSYSYPQGVLMSQRAFGGYGGAAAETPTAVNIGMLQLTASVTVAYELDYNPGDTEFLKPPAD